MLFKFFRCFYFLKGGFENVFGFRGSEKNSLLPKLAAGWKRGLGRVYFLRGDLFWSS